MQGAWRFQERRLRKSAAIVLATAIAPAAAAELMFMSEDRILEGDPLVIRTDVRDLVARAKNSGRFDEAARARLQLDAADLNAAVGRRDDSGGGGSYRRWLLRCFRLLL